MNTSKLLEKLASGTATQADYHHFNEWFEAMSETEQHEILTTYESLLPYHNDHNFPSTLTEKIARRIRYHEEKKQKAKIFSMVKWAAAAAVLAAISWLVWPSLKISKTQPAALATTPVVQDKEPASQGAILTLSNGSIINLDSIANGSIATQGGMKLIKKDGQLIYAANPDEHAPDAAAKNAALAYNMIQAPRGRQFQLVLPDGSNVWLNAASSIRYPIAFEPSERQVTITGEVYFEIAKEVNRPFKVRFHTARAGSGEVEVLGTHFNINAYPDEPVVSTTLLEGKVKLSPIDTTSTSPMPGYALNPGTQGILNKPSGKSPQIHLQPANMEETMAWKNGRFVFNETPIVNIMRQVARWYDVEIIYPKAIPEKKFTADLSRQTRLSEFMKVMEVSVKGFHFIINEKTLTVTLK
jgi:transmembrane sensor